MAYSTSNLGCKAQNGPMSRPCLPRLTRGIDMLKSKKPLLYADFGI
jgi:hypothetical protein